MGNFEFPLDLGNGYNGKVEQTDSPYDALILEVIGRRGKKSISQLALELHGSWNMTSEGARQTINKQLESGAAWERLAIPKNGNLPDKIEPDKSVRQVRCEHMCDYLKKIAYNPAERKEFFQRLHCIDNVFDYVPR